ncbi:uncharacterized protein C8R40DRAFT_133529 [Lentinula edodes]|uniref:uncharacterized protein n=1 Tax=Lentinula edodes TaxID=5353 RepID=UPI001E8D61E6|nr:uncharacterized protein C8R40DRAFT_133529 [Lentinula edodes]KAH7876403.1 hypothetical protein C8R40DRAFT_133529 [Lentinula edodes]
MGTAKRRLLSKLIDSPTTGLSLYNVVLGLYMRLQKHHIETARFPSILPFSFSLSFIQWSIVYLFAVQPESRYIVIV